MKLALGIIAIIILILLLRVGELYTQLARYQGYWDRVNQNSPAKDELVYAAFGDSAAQGIGASRPDKGYVGLIAKELAETSGKSVRVINLSKSGARINDVTDTQLAKYKALKLSGNQVITVDIGANDIVRTGLQDFEKDMDRLMSKLPKDAIIADIPSFKGSRYMRLEDRIIEANKIMYRLAEKHGFELAKVHDSVSKNHGIRTFSADLFHPSDYGYKTNWLPAFMDSIKSSGQNS